MTLRFLADEFVLTHKNVFHNSRRNVMYSQNIDSDKGMIP